MTDAQEETAGLLSDAPSVERSFNEGVEATATAVGGAPQDYHYTGDQLVTVYHDDKVLWFVWQQHITGYNEARGGYESTETFVTPATFNRVDKTWNEGRRDGSKPWPSFLQKAGEQQASRRGE